MKTQVRIAGELAVIVAGILIALGADAAWQGRADRRLEREYLEAFRLDLRATIDANQVALSAQQNTQAWAQDWSDLITTGAPLPDTLLRVFPPISVLGESMDTYRDLVASGGTTRISSLEVRRAMSQTLSSVEYNQVAETWALDLITSMRASVWTVARPVERERLAELWAIYLDAGGRVIDGKFRLAASADSALAVVGRELEG